MTQSVDTPALPSIRSLGLPTLVFVLCKSTAFLAPMLLARALPLNDYGQIELALAWGTPSAIAVGLGLHGAVPYFLLKLRQPEAIRVILQHVGYASLLLSMLALSLHFAPLSRVVPLAIFISAIFCAQNILTALLKSEAHPAMASFVEVAVYCVLFVAALLAYGFHLPIHIDGVFWIVFATAVAFGAISLLLATKRPMAVQGSYPIYRATLQFGVPLIFSGLMSTLLMSGGRILIGAVLGDSDVAIFSLLFRMAAAAVLVHQLATTVLFPRLYKAGPALLGRYLGAMQAAILAACVVACVGSIVIGPRLFPALRHTAANTEAIAIALGLQMFFWCACAHCEIAFYRENLGSLFAKWLGVILVVMIGATILLARYTHPTLLSLTRLQMCIMWLSDCGAMILLWRREIPLRLPLLLNNALFLAYWIGVAVVAAAGHTVK